jgi:hypothetical protein
METFIVLHLPGFYLIDDCARNTRDLNKKRTGF